MLPPCFARDFIVEFAGENHKEIQTSPSYSPLIYHSLHVNSEVGPKLLILTGNNTLYRKSEEKNRLNPVDLAKPRGGGGGGKKGS